jgi:hypothetical protein
VTGATATTATYAGTETGTVTYDYTSAKGCKAEQKSAKVTIKPTPAAPTTTPFSKCLNVASEPLDNYVTAASGATLKWYGTTGTGTGSPTAPTPSRMQPSTSSSTIVDG